jgi:general secretion pathway protein E/type IV pilus assembly protein PilB
MDEDLDNIVAMNGSKAELRAAARKKGFKAMIDDGILKIYQGVTSLDAATKCLNFADRT